MYLEISMDNQNTSKHTSFFDKCRLCLDQEGISVIHEMRDLPADIYLCTGIKITESDGLPTKICKTCLDIVFSSIQFKITACKNDEYLRSLIWNDDNDQDIVDSTNKSDEDEPDIIKYNFTKQNETSTKFLSVRKDIFETSIPEVSYINKEEIVQEDSPKTSNLLYNKSGGENKCQYKCVISTTDENQVNEKKVVVCNDGDKGYICKFKCSVCKKVFDKWKKLYLHLRTHNKSITCPVNKCSKKFATKGDLEKHARTHTGEKPYTCDQCEKGFSQRGQLKMHKQGVHQTKSETVSDESDM